MYASLHSGESHLVLMMNVSDDRHRRTRHNLRKTFCSFDFITRTTNDVATSSRQRVNLLQRTFDIGSLGDRHRLHRDRCSSTNGNFAHHDLTSRATIRERASGGGHCLHSVSV